MTPSVYIDAIAAFTNALLGLFVLARAPRGQVQRAFTCLAISISVWITSILTVQTANVESVARAGIEAAFASSLVMAASMVWFGALFPGPNRLENGSQVRFYVLAGIMLAALSPLGAYDRGVQRAAGGVWAPHRGPLSAVGSLYLVLAAVFVVYCIGAGWRNSRGLQRAQLQYLLLGSILALAGAFAANLVAPLVFHSSRYESFGPAASLLFVLASGYSIARYRLLEISQVILKGVAFGLALTAMAGFFLAAVVLLDRLAASVLRVHTVEAQAVAAMVLAMLFQPLYQALRRLLNIVFVRRPYDYAQTLRAASRGMTSLLDLEQLRAHVTTSITDHMQVEWAGLAVTRGHRWLPESDIDETENVQPSGDRRAPKGSFRVTANQSADLSNGSPSSGVSSNGNGRGGRDDPSHLTHFKVGDPSNNPFSPSLVWTMLDGQTVLREEAAQNDGDRTSRRIARRMERLGADVAVPLLFKDELLGILLVGPKRSGAMFTEEDITLLSTLANQAAIALRNGQLYHEVQSNHEYTQAILERLDSAVVTVDSKAEPIVANAAAVDLLPNRGGRVVLPTLLQSMVHKVFRTGKEQPNLEFDLLDRSGQSLPVIATVCPFLSESGVVESALIVIRDISALRRLEDERLRVERLSSISRVAATLAHEIRNPLASIKTFCQLMPEKYLDDEFRETFTQISLDEVNRIDALVGTLLSVEKPAIGLKERVKVQDAIASTLKLIEPLARENDLLLDYRQEDIIPDIVGDGSQLRQLFLNLMLNAREAAPPGTTLEVHLSYQPDVGIVVDVINQGSPITPGNLAHLFEPFFTTKERGTGLGLTVCKQVAEYHGGSIAALSGPEGETTFRVTLPAPFHSPDKTL